MVSFRLPDFRLFHLFRDRQQSPAGDYFPQHPGPASVPERHDQRRRSQNQSGQYPVFFNPSAETDSGPWHGYTSHPSQANPLSYPSRLPGQYQQQHQQTRNRHSLQTRSQFQSKPQPQTSHAQPSSYGPNGSSNPNPNPYYRHRDHHPPQDGLQHKNQKSGFPGGNTPFRHSQSYLPSQPVQSSSQQAWTPVSNASRMPSRHESQKLQKSQPTASLNVNRGRSHSQGSHTRVRDTSRTSGASPRRGTSSAPQIKSRMLKISLVHPLVCGHRHSLIPNQIPETEVGKPERSVWDAQQFSLPQGSQVPMMIDAVQVCSLSLEWDITFPPSFAKEIGKDGQIFTPPRHLHLPLINAKFKSDVCIKTRQDNPLTKCFLRWGCIVVESRDPNAIPPTMKQFLHDIWDYFRTPLTEEECLVFTRDDLAKLHQIAESRAEKYANEGELPPFIQGRGLSRRDVLWGYTRFCGLELCPRFADTGDLFLYLEPS